MKKFFENVKFALLLIYLAGVVVVFLSPLLWAWDSWDLAWRVALSAGCVSFTCNIFIKGIEQAIEEKAKPQVPKTSRFAERLEEMAKRQKENQ